MNCDKCGKTLTEVVKHKEKHFCKECYDDIFKE
jgi:hypothetical protein